MEYDDNEDEFKVIIEFDYLTAQNLNAIPENLQKRIVDYIVPSYDGLLKIDIILAKWEGIITWKTTLERTAEYAHFAERPTTSRPHCQEPTIKPKFAEIAQSRKPYRALVLEEQNKILETIHRYSHKMED